MKSLIMMLLVFAVAFAAFDTYQVIRNVPFDHIPYFLPMVFVLFAIIVRRVERETPQSPPTDRTKFS